MRRNGNFSTSYFQFFLLKHVASRLLFVVALPAAIYISTFYVHLTLLTKAGPNDDIMTSAFQASLEVPYNLPCNGLFALPESDSDSDSEPNGYIAMQKFLHCKESESDPNLTAIYRNGIGIRVRTRVRLPQCKLAITVSSY